MLLVLAGMLSMQGAAWAQPSTPADPFPILELPASALTLPTDTLAAPQLLPPQNPKFDTAVARVAARVAASEREALATGRAEGFRLDDNRVYLQAVVEPSGLAAVTAAITALGGRVTGVGDRDSLLQGWFPLDALAPLAARADVLQLRRPDEALPDENPVPQAGSQVSEGLGPLNAVAWHDAGFKGAGVKIGIIDAGFSGYSSLLGSDLPANVTVRSFVDGGSETNMGTSVHGTACAEIIHDLAPDAQLFLARINTRIDLAEAVAWLKDVHQVDIISTSVSWFAETPGDGTGFFADLVRSAREAGIFWVTSAGNNRERHWGGLFNDPGSTGLHTFNTAQSQNINYFGPGSGGAYNISAGTLIDVYVRWDDWTNPTQDYNLILYRFNSGSASWVQVAASANPQTGVAGQRPVESIRVFAPQSGAYGFAVQRVNSNRDVNLSIFAVAGARLDEAVPERSLGNLPDSPDIVAVAALDVNSPYPQESYSSQGPTLGPGGALLGGAQKPDLAGYANVATASYAPALPYKFNGTSAATPHAAGAAALVLSARPSTTADELEAFLKSRAADMGTPGEDTITGAGRLFLGEPTFGRSLALSDATVTEGDAATATLVFTATLSTPSATPVTVSYATADGTAAAPGDYSAVPPTTLTFAAGQTTRAISVTVRGDTLVEADETVLLTLSSPVGASILDGQGTGTIVDDDLPQLSLSDATVTEGDAGTTTLVFTAILSAASPRQVTVSYATGGGTASAPGDYTAVPPTTLTFAAGQTTRAISVSVRGDTLVEADETVLLTLSSPVAASILDGQGTGTILNDDGLASAPNLLFLPLLR